VACSPSLALLLPHAERIADPAVAKVHLDGNQGEWVFPAVAIQDRRQWGVCQSETAVWDAWGDVRPAASADDFQSAGQDADVERSADPVQDDPAQDGQLRQIVQALKIWEHLVARDGSGPDTQDAAQFAAQSCVGLVAAFARWAFRGPVLTVEQQMELPVLLPQAQLPAPEIAQQGVPELAGFQPKQVQPEVVLVAEQPTPLAHMLFVQVWPELRLLA
jgi:hypothetical protein